MLSHPDLQNTIRSIDSSATRFEDLEMRLEADKDFHDFIVKVMQAMGYFDNEGRFVDPLESEKAA